MLRPKKKTPASATEAWAACRLLPRFARDAWLRGHGYGIRYDYGIFTQIIDENGGQRELASSWLAYQNFWENGRGSVRYRVRFGGVASRRVMAMASSGGNGSTRAMSGLLPTIS